MNLPDPDSILFGPTHGCVGCGGNTPNRCPGLVGSSCGSLLCTRCARYDDDRVCGTCRHEADREELRRKCDRQEAGVWLKQSARALRTVRAELASEAA